MIEHLKNLRSDVASMRSEMHTEFKDIKARLNHLDASMAGVRRDGTLSELASFAFSSRAS